MTNPERVQLGDFVKDAREIFAPLTAQIFNYSVHVSLKNKYLFYETPKVACSTIKSTLHAFEFELPGFRHRQPGWVHLREISPLLRPCQVGPVRAFLDRTDIFRFCFVRNPYERALSAYLDKIVRHEPQKRAILTALGRDPAEITAPVSFEEFLEVLAGQSPEQMDNHWMPQAVHLLGGRIAFDFVGRFERFEQDFAHVAARIGCDLSLYRTDVQSHRTGAAGAFAAHYTARTTDLVRRIYDADFTMFGYPDPLPATAAAA